MKKGKSNDTLTSRQIWSIAILLMIIIIAVACWRLLPIFNDEQQQPNQITVDWKTQNNDKSFSTESNVKYSTEQRIPSKQNDKDKQTTVQVNLFQFDPNTATLEEFVQLGLRPKVAQTIVNYRNKGGKFYNKEDFAKIYTLPEEDYERLLPYIKITSIEAKPHYKDSKSSYIKDNNYSSTNKFPQKNNKPLDVNSASVEQLMELKGIGNGYANRIIKYRDILGGYHKVEQLKEVYGMTDSLYEAIKPFMIIDKENIKQIAINTASEEDLYKHPYIRKMAKYIVAYRKEIGGFKQIEEFRQVPLINEEIYRKLVPYLGLNN